jgi:hypothetical protein
VLLSCHALPSLYLHNCYACAREILVGTTLPPAVPHTQVT